MDHAQSGTQTTRSSGKRMPCDHFVSPQKFPSLVRVLSSAWKSNMKVAQSGTRSTSPEDSSTPSDHLSSPG